MNRAIADSVIRIPCQNLQGFFESWFNLLRPIHKLSNTEIKLLATMARFRHEYALNLKSNDKDLADEYIMYTETKQKIREACKMTPSSFQVSMHKLKKAGVIRENRIDPRLIPNLIGGDYKLLLFFDLREHGQEKDQLHDRPEDREGHRSGDDEGTQGD